MSGFLIDSQIWNDPRFIGVSPEAIVLWTFAGAWCAGQSNDGFIPASVVTPDTAPLAAELVRRGLWRHVEGGCRIVDWHHVPPKCSLHVIPGGKP